MSLDQILWILAAIAFGVAAWRPTTLGIHLVPIGLCLGAITFII